jgi:hypothetical protein
LGGKQLITAKENRTKTNRKLANQKMSEKGKTNQKMPVVKAPKMSNKTKCPHCDKEFVSVKQHITKMHNKYTFVIPKALKKYILGNFEGEDVTDNIKLIHVNPDGIVKEHIFDSDITRAGVNGEDLIVECNRYILRWTYETDVMYLEDVLNPDTSVRVHIGRYKVIVE